MINFINAIVMDSAIWVYIVELCMFGFIVWAMKSGIITPLQRLTDKTENIDFKLTEYIHNTDTRLVAVEKSSNSAHKRLDDFNHDMNNRIDKSELRITNLENELMHRRGDDT